MSIRIKLIIFIPAIIVLVNFAAFFIFQSGRSVQQSYNNMLERLLLYSQLTEKTQQNLSALNLYLNERSRNSFDAYKTERSELGGMAANLSAQHPVPETALALESYANMLTAFMQQEEATMQSSSKPGSLEYAALYANAEKTASYITDQGSAIIDLELGYYQPFYRQMFVQTEKMNRWASALILTDTIMGIGFALWLASSITGPIKRLVYSAKQVSQGRFQIERPVITSRDELGILSEAFSRMLDDLIEQMAKEKDSLETERLVKELELKALQNQINPHFLFNTLNVLSKLAFLEGAEKTSDLTVTVSNLLRYNLRELNRLVPLQDEVEHIQAYVTIQLARFRDRVSFESEINPLCLQVPVPPLSLQPLVENAFIHGIESMETGAVIKLKIEQDGTDVLISISDNGVGMPEDVRQALLQPEHEGLPNDRQIKTQTTGIGTRNVFRRLALQYGRDDLIQIQSSPGEGTTIMIRIPEQERRGRDVPAADRG
ncbi:sensor histidine kinase [Paenibacillus protaetiae]|uniref:histidine kinase n=1 Tax=Paenibacillus protaetiae TaxID=2509456 RepID=A0A4P6F4Y9_9BACL|nr:histidine kinase [Paenibacillus protaetiae]QAY68257.1 HAMP domain-containing protein [Paenibacillus protaetiae]